MAADSHELLLTSAALRGLAATGEPEKGLQRLRESLAVAWELPGSNEKQVNEKRLLLRRLVESVAYFGNTQAGSALLQDVLAHLPGQGDEIFQGEILGACVKVAGQLGDRPAAFSLLEQIVSLVRTLITHEDSYLFEVFSLCLENLADLGALTAGQKIVRSVEVMLQEVDRDQASTAPELSYSHLFHRARALCGYGLAEFGEAEAGSRLVLQALEGSKQADTFGKMDLLKTVSDRLAAFPRRERVNLARQTLHLLFSATDLGGPVQELQIQILDHAIQSLVAGESVLLHTLRRWERAEERRIRERLVREQRVR